MVSKVQLNKAKNLVRGYKAARGKAGSGEGSDGGGISGSGKDSGDGEEGSVIDDAMDDGGSSSDGGSGDHISVGGSDGDDNCISVRGSDDDDKGSGDDGNSEDVGTDDNVSCDNIDLDSSMDGGDLLAGEIQEAGRLPLYSSGESDQDDYQPLVTSEGSAQGPSCNSAGGCMKNFTLTAPKKKSVGSSAKQNQGQKSARRKTIAIKEGSTSGRRPKADSLFVSTLRERRTRKQVCDYMFVLLIMRLHICIGMPMCLCLLLLKREQ